MARTTIRVDCWPLSQPDIGAVDRLARRLLSAKRQGRELRLLNASDRLLELIRLSGIGDLLVVEPRGQAEEREEGGGVEEEGQLGDAAAAQLEDL